ncbi:cytochrome P450 monooxygenase [Amylocystis lapponica]|nr:cytochrome P450 monooxygenase [Amylocystis lapponica]
MFTLPQRAIDITTVFFSNPTIIALAAPVLLIICHNIYTGWRDYGLRRPPGPRPIPLLGNVLQLRDGHQYKTFAQWGKIYGDVICAELFQTPVLIINSLRAAQDLMEKKGSIYSDRPNMILHVELMGFDCTCPQMKNGARLRKHRRWIQKAYGDKSTLGQYHPLLRRETDFLLSSLFDSPGDFKIHFVKLLASVVAESVYGYTIASRDDPYTQLAEEATTAATDGAGPAAMLVDFFPLLKYIPTWMPGAGWKGKAADVRVLVRRLLDQPFEFVKAEMARGTAKSTLTRTLLEEVASNEASTANDHDDVKGAVGIIYAAATETSVTTLTIFILAMVLFPNALKNAQEEIDRVVGTDRVPSFGDRESLPYLECVLKEVYRWQPAVPIGIPHSLTVNDQYRGYDIPAGSTVLPNIWYVAMSRDEEFYPDPETFRPERFAELDGSLSELKDPRNMVFGFGRRICPGRHFADLAVWLVMANIIATFDIRKARDTAGNEITPQRNFVLGFISHPEMFACDIHPRSQKAVDLITGMNVVA